MERKNIEIKAIKDLLSYNFFIPSYQRGYRWTKDQVRDLLNDVWEFINNPNKKDDEWYCLQPIVVTERNNDITWHDVIDGQQRLTTIFLLLKHLESSIIKCEKKNFIIQYETRKGSDSFLEKINTKTENESNGNVDYFHIYNAYSTIQDWFQQIKVNEGYNSINNLNSVFVEKLLKNVKIIWYETPPNENSITIFTRINIGKIHLTNAELIKALFLNSSNFPNADTEKLQLKQSEIALEWDRIEYSLQNDSFWYFINKNENNLATRIEFIFNLISDKSNNDKYSTFYFFNEKFKAKSEEEINNNWKEIKKYFQTLEEWFNDRELYHKIGYLITIGTNIKNILNEKKEKPKTAFTNWINEEIKSKFKNINLDKIEYNGGYIREILLLHNIQTMLNNENETNRFPFERYKKEDWDIEHIHAIATKVKVKKEKQVDWLKNNFVETENHKENELNNQIKKIINSGDTIKESEFEEIVHYVLGDEDNSLGNLCLLDSGTNRSYKNDSFKEKRKKIIEREIQGIFIPICTKNIFMKYYSIDVKDIEVWNEKDRASYLEKIQEVISQYLPQTALTENEQ